MTNKTFLFGPLKKARLQGLVDREKSLLPDTLRRFEAIENIGRLDRRLAKFQTRIQNIRRTMYGVSLKDLKDIVKVSEGLHEEIKDITQGYEYWRPKVSTSTIDDSSSVVTMNCPADDCAGFLSSDFRCLKCSCLVCKHCHVILPNVSKDHTCKEEDKATVKLIKTDSKNCPKCAVFIHRIFGCNQMFCTNCKSVFDWVSLRIINGPVHNPHYFEYMASRAGSEDPAAAGHPAAGNHGGDCVNADDAILALNRLSRLVPNFVQGPLPTMIILHQRATECLEFVRTATVTYTENLYSDVRREYLFDGISEESFIRKLSIRDSSMQRTQAFSQIHEMFGLAASDILVRSIPVISDCLVFARDTYYRYDWMAEGQRKKDKTESDEEVMRTKLNGLHPFVDEAEQLRFYYNREILKQSKFFNYYSDDTLNPEYYWIKTPKNSLSEKEKIVLYGLEIAEDDDT